MPDDDLVCPECGGPIGQTSTFCMHCSADLTDRQSAAASTTDGTRSRQSRAVEEWGDDGSGTAGDEPRDDAGTSPTEDTEEASRAAIPPAYRSTSGTTTPSLVPENFLLKAISFVLAVGVAFAVGLGSTVALTALIANDLAFFVGVFVALGATMVLLRVTPA